MLGQTVQDAMNEQLKNELFSAYAYLSGSAYFESMTLPGFARWMQVQSQEEVAHAMKFFQFIIDRGGRVVLQAIDPPPVDFQSPLQVFEQGLTHEQKVTGMTHQLYALAVSEKDYASQTFLQWFVTEQVEEEKNTLQIVEMLKMIADQSYALLMPDKELGGRETGD